MVPFSTRLLNTQRFWSLARKGVVFWRISGFWPFSQPFPPRTAGETAGRFRTIADLFIYDY